MKLHIAIRHQLSLLPEETKDSTESMVEYLCEERKAHSFIVQQAILRLVLVMEQEFAVQNFRLGETETMRLVATRHVLRMLDYGEQVMTAEMSADVDDKALRYVKDKTFRQETQHRLAAAGHPKDSVEREIARRCIESAATVERLSASISSRFRSALKALHDAEKLARR